jgi:hypothetical protein
VQCATSERQPGKNLFPFHEAPGTSATLRAGVWSSALSPRQAEAAVVITWPPGRRSSTEGQALRDDRDRSVAGASRAASRALAFANCGTLVPECCLHAGAQARVVPRPDRKRKRQASVAMTSGATAPEPSRRLLVGECDRPPQRGSGTEWAIVSSPKDAQARRGSETNAIVRTQVCGA